MTEGVRATLPLTRWQGEKAVYHLVTFTGPEAEALAGHALMQRLEFGRRAGFGSVKVLARIGDTEWRTSVFPQSKSTEWILLISKKVMRLEGLTQGDNVSLIVELL